MHWETILQQTLKLKSIRIVIVRFRESPANQSASPFSPSRQNESQPSACFSGTLVSSQPIPMRPLFALLRLALTDSDLQWLSPAQRLLRLRQFVRKAAKLDHRDTKTPDQTNPVGSEWSCAH